MSKGGGNMSIHYIAEPQTAQLLLRTVGAVSQLRIYGALATWRNNQTPPSVQSHAEVTTAPEVPPDVVTLLAKLNTSEPSFGKKWSVRCHHIL